MTLDQQIITTHDPLSLDPAWDSLADCYFKQREFLSHMHRTNQCQQRYYQLFNQKTFKAGAVVYTLSINLFTYSKFTLPVRMTVIGLPASVAPSGLVGSDEHYEPLLSFILEQEHGLILGLNFDRHHLKNTVANMRTLPTILFEGSFKDLDEYKSSLNSHYRRRMNRIQEKFQEVKSSESACSEFSNEHYQLYLQIMKHTSTKLEILQPEFFKELPEIFHLWSYRIGARLVCWHIVCEDAHKIYFLFGGMDYELRDQYQAYNNNLFGILEGTFKNGFSKIDFGQTAETSKIRLGGIPDERYMFLFHRNKFFFSIFKLIRPLLTYAVASPRARVFKEGNLS